MNGGVEQVSASDLPHHRRRRVRPAAADLLGRRRSASSRRDVRDARGRSAPVPPRPRRRCGRWGADHWSGRRPRRLRRCRALGRWNARTGRRRSGQILRRADPAPRRSRLARDGRATSPELPARQPRIRRVTSRSALGVARRSSSASCSPTSHPSSTKSRRRTRCRRHVVVRDRRRQDRDLPPVRSHGRVLRPAARQARGHHLVGPFPAAHALAPADPAFRGRARCGRAGRRDEGSLVDPFSLGFFVGNNGTPNRIPTHETTGLGSRIPTDPDMPGRYQVLLRCPFCTSPDSRCGSTPTDGRSITCARRHAVPGADSLCRCASSMRRSTARSDRRTRDPRQGREHLDAGRDARILRPASRACTGQTTVTPTRRGAGSPGAVCSPAVPRPRARWRKTRGSTRRPFACRTNSICSVTVSVLSTRTTRPCWTDCNGTMARRRRSSPRPRPSPVTTSRWRPLPPRGRTFPRPGPRVGHSLWSRDTAELARRFAGLAPRGVTLEFATDQPTEALQRVTRRAVEDPGAVAAGDRRRGRRSFRELVSQHTASTSSTGRTSRTSKRSHDLSTARSSSTPRSTPRPSQAERRSTRCARPSLASPVPSRTSTTVSTSSPPRRCCRTASTSTVSTSW